MGKIVKANNPCPECGGSDPLQIYEDGSAYCFSCTQSYSKTAVSKMDISGTSFNPYTMNLKKKSEAYAPKFTMEQMLACEVRGIKDRFISKPVCEFYNVRSIVDEEGEFLWHHYIYGANSAKSRDVPVKKFKWLNKIDRPYGINLFAAGQKRLVICEGEMDTLSVAMAYWMRYKKIYPTIGVSASSMIHDLAESLPWIRSHKEIVIAMDNDSAGKKGVKAVIKMIGVGKCKLVHFDEGVDCNDVLVKEGYKALLSKIYEAQIYNPPGILGRDEIRQRMKEISNLPVLPYPGVLEDLGKHLDGQRLHEMNMYISGTGAGKTTLVKEIMIELIENTEHTVGILSLEEMPGTTARKLSLMAVSKNPGNKESWTEKDEDEGFEILFSEDRLKIIDHGGDKRDDSIVDKIEYLAAIGCSLIVVDHITLLVSEGVDDKTGNEAQDLMMNKLSSILMNYPVHIALIAHLRKTSNDSKSFEEGAMPSLDDIKGSGSLKQVPCDIVAFTRNMSSDDVNIRNKIMMRVLKARETGNTGNCAPTFFNKETGRIIKYVKPEDRFEQQEDDI